MVPTEPQVFPTKSLFEAGSQAVREALEERLKADAHDSSVLQQVIRQATAKVIKAETSRRPVILPVLLEL